MEELPQRVHIASASAFAVLVALIGITLVMAFAAGKPQEYVVGVFFFIGAIVGVTNVTLVLCAKSFAAVAKTARVLAWIGSLNVVTGLGLGCLVAIV